MSEHGRTYSSVPLWWNTLKQKLLSRPIDVAASKGEGPA
jgi:hypothetical protein